MLPCVVNQDLVLFRIKVRCHGPNHPQLMGDVTTYLRHQQLGLLKRLCLDQVAGRLARLNPKRLRVSSRAGLADRRRLRFRGRRFRGRVAGHKKCGRNQEDEESRDNAHTYYVSKNSELSNSAHTSRAKRGRMCPS